MTTNSEIETRLHRAVAFEPSEDGLRWLDQRVGQLAARPVALPRRGFSFPRLVLRPVLVVAAFVVLAGAVAGGVGLLDQIFQSSAMPGWRIAWDRAERLDLTATDAGVTITLERAYADLNQVLVGFTVGGLEPPPLTDHGDAAELEWRADLRDPAGRLAQEWAPSETGTAITDPNLSAIGNFWEGAVTPVGGTWVLTFTSVGFNAGGFVSGECTVGNTDPACLNPPANAMVDGIWRFEFALPAPTGTVVTPNVSVTQGQATLTLTELRITPTVIAGTIVLRVANSTVAQWGPGPISVSVRHGGTSYLINHVSTLSPEEALKGLGGGDDDEFRVLTGSDEAAGTWEIEIPELWYQTTMRDPEVRLTGPWTLTVTVP
jgi:hypothetical protein